MAQVIARTTKADTPIPTHTYKALLELNFGLIS